MAKWSAAEVKWSGVEWSEVKSAAKQKVVNIFARATSKNKGRGLTKNTQRMQYIEWNAPKVAIIVPVESNNNNLLLTFVLLVVVAVGFYCLLR